MTSITTHLWLQHLSCDIWGPKSMLMQNWAKWLFPEAQWGFVFFLASVALFWFSGVTALMSLSTLVNVCHTNLLNSDFYLLSVLLFSVLIDRYMMAKTPRPVFLETSHTTPWWAMLSTVRPITCGWSSTATPLEPIRAFASHTQVSNLWEVITLDEAIRN